MAAATVRFRPADYRLLLEHLLPAETEAEEAAFLFASPGPDPGALAFEVQEVQLVPPELFETRSPTYLALSSAGYERAIKRAHDLNLAMMEVHSHPFPGAAQLSWSDKRGLREAVPHVMWRLPGRPYTALVFAPGSFDGLFWLERGADPQPLKGLHTGRGFITPTGLSLHTWEAGDVTF